MHKNILVCRLACARSIEALEHNYKWRFFAPMALFFLHDPRPFILTPVFRWSNAHVRAIIWQCFMCSFESVTPALFQISLTAFTLSTKSTIIARATLAAAFHIASLTYLCEYGTMRCDADIPQSTLRAITARRNLIFLTAPTSLATEIPHVDS